MECLGCNVLMVPQTKGDYCHVCREAIKRHRQGEKKPKQPIYVQRVVEGFARDNRYSQHSLAFGARRPRIYVRRMP